MLTVIVLAAAAAAAAHMWAVVTAAPIIPLVESSSRAAAAASASGTIDAGHGNVQINIKLPRMFLQLPSKGPKSRIWIWSTLAGAKLNIFETLVRSAGRHLRLSSRKWLSGPGDA